MKDVCCECVHWDRENTYWDYHEDGYVASCLCPNRPPSTGATLPDDWCHRYEENENEVE